MVYFHKIRQGRGHVLNVLCIILFITCDRSRCCIIYVRTLWDFIGILSDRIRHPIQLDTVINPLSVIPTLRSALAAAAPESRTELERRRTRGPTDSLGTGEVAARALGSQTVADIETILAMKD